MFRIKQVIYAILPRFSSEVGHVLQYHLSVEKATRSLGWRYIAFVPEKTECDSLPQHWEHCLANDTSLKPKNIIQKLAILFANISPLRKIFRRKEATIMFIEHFELLHLASIALAFFPLTPSFCFWILHRYNIHSKKKALLCRIFHWYIERKIGAKNIRFLTDSELLAGELKKIFNRSFSVIPIPHTENVTEKKEQKKTEDFLFWWPGGQIREDKGLSVILKFLKVVNNRIKLVVAESGRTILGENKHILYIPAVLSRIEYTQWMQKADLVLLPYMAEEYAYRTSGIFVEAIVLGAMPVVTKKTWMSHELDRFGLSRLTFDWNEQDLLNTLCSFVNNPLLINGLENMRNEYKQYHSEDGFALKIKEFCT